MCIHRYINTHTPRRPQLPRRPQPPPADALRHLELVAAGRAQRRVVQEKGKGGGGGLGIGDGGCGVDGRGVREVSCDVYTLRGVM